MNKALWQQYGLSEMNGKRIIDVLSRFSEVEEAVLFGSRAKSNYRRGSDIDIAVKGTISKDVLSALLVAFDETVLPYFVDIVVYEHITNLALKGILTELEFAFIRCYENEIRRYVCRMRACKFFYVPLRKMGYFLFLRNGDYFSHSLYICAIIYIKF